MKLLEKNGWRFDIDNLFVKRDVIENVGFIKINNPPVNAMSVKKSPTINS